MPLFNAEYAIFIADAVPTSLPKSMNAISSTSRPSRASRAGPET
jgi:hypothetical protein